MLSEKEKDATRTWARDQKLAVDEVELSIAGRTRAETTPPSEQQEESDVAAQTM